MADLKERIFETFIKLIEISEVYPHEERIIVFVMERLKQAGVSVKQDAFGNIIGSISGKGPALLLSTHMDVPEDNPGVRWTREGDILKTDGTMILGADPKSGLAILLELARDLHDASQNRAVGLVITRGEEAGLIGARNLDFDMVSAREGIVLDEDGGLKNLVVQAPASEKIDVTITGKQTHSRNPELGINALQVAVSALAKLPWGYLEEGVSWNVAPFQSGVARNTTPGKCTLSAEIRGLDTAQVKKNAQRVRSVFEDVALEHEASCIIKDAGSYSGYNLKEDVFTKNIIEKMESFGVETNAYATLGASDANVFNENGIKCIPMGSGYYDAHEYTERVDLTDMVQIHQFLMHLLA